ncbi:MAG: InlB B-repeat-containing protein [Chitinivibrionia bacterium]|nr:InlB B-repeat-containing protein [Chitinivibrionia bacterium]
MKKILGAFSVLLCLLMVGGCGFYGDEIEINVAVPVQRVTVTFNSQGGTSFSSQTVNAGQSVWLPTPSRSGFVFNGWFTSSSGGSRVGWGETNLTVWENRTLWAQWTATTPSQFTVTFNANGGTVSPTSRVVNAGTSTTLPTPTRSGFTFNGWFTSSSGGTRVGGAGSSYTVNSNITLWAQWTATPSQFTVTFNANGGTVSPTSRVVNAGTPTTLPTPTRSGFTFNGWFTSSSGGTRVGSAGDSYWVNSNITLWAQWTSISSSIIILSLNVPATVSITSGVRREVRFTAPSTGTYIFQSSNRGSLDPTAYTALTGGSIIDDDSAGDRNFWFSRALTAGQTFTFWAGVWNNTGTGSYTVTVTR